MLTPQQRPTREVSSAHHRWSRPTQVSWSRMSISVSKRCRNLVDPHGRGAKNVNVPTSILVSMIIHLCMINTDIQGYTSVHIHSYSYWYEKISASIYMNRGVEDQQVDIAAGSLNQLCTLGPRPYQPALGGSQVRSPWPQTFDTKVGYSKEQRLRRKFRN